LGYDDTVLRQKVASVKYLDYVQALKANITANNVCASPDGHVCVLVSVRALACVKFLDYRSLMEKNLTVMCPRHSKNKIDL